MDHALTTEALIVGGGPAGLAASIALRQRGIDCTVIEARPTPIDKACGEGLMPDSRETLADLGVRLDEADGHVFHGIRFENAMHHVDARFPAVQASECAAPTCTRSSQRELRRWVRD